MSTAWMKHTALFAIQCLVTAGVLAWVFHDGDRRGAMLQALGRADLRWVAAGLVLSGVGEVASFMRWGLCMRVQGIPIRWLHVCRLFFIGQFFNLFVLGATGGDAAKSYYVVVDTGSSKMTAILSVIMDRLISLVTLSVTAVGMILWRYDYLTQTPVTAGLLYFLIVFLGCAVAALAGGIAIIGFQLAHKLPVRLPWRSSLIQLSTACSLFGRAWKKTLLAIAVSEVSLLTFFAAFYCAARAFQASVSLGDIFAVMPVVTVITALPISINGVGVREKLFEQLLGNLSGVPAEIAVLASLTGFLMFVFWSLVGAGVYLTHHRSTPRDAGESTVNGG